MKFGYARVSTPEQSMENQIENLKAAGCERIFSDKVSGSKAKRPGFEEMVKQLRTGDTVTLTSLDRLGRTSKLLLHLLEEWQKENIHIHILSLEMDTSSSAGKLMYSIMAAMAECERNLGRERTLKGLEGARARGRKGGRPPKLSEKQIERMIQLYNEKRLSLMEIRLMYGIGKTTLFNYIKREIKSQL
jgi:DNA invertase Pin-like site-specific DNA recombinase